MVYDTMPNVWYIHTLFATRRTAPRQPLASSQPFNKNADPFVSWFPHADPLLESHKTTAPPDRPPLPNIPVYPIKPSPMQQTLGRLEYLQYWTSFMCVSDQETEANASKSSAPTTPNQGRENFETQGRLQFTPAERRRVNYFSSNQRK